jgi:predicted neuraminidase
MKTTLLKLNLEHPEDAESRKPSLISVSSVFSALKTVLFFLVVDPAHAASHPAITTAEFINDNAPYPECHASTIVELRRNQLAAAWFGGTKERNPDVGIWFTRQEDGKWQQAVEVATGIQASGPRLPTWNPVLFLPAKGPLHLFYKVGPSPSQWWGMVITTLDDGKTWSAPRRLPDGILGPVKNKMVQLRNFDWLSASSTEGNRDGPSTELRTGWLVHFELSRDDGRTWTKIGPVAKGPGFDAIQPSILIHADGALQALCRTKQGVVAQTWSRDGGKTWSALTATDLPNPNSGTDAVTLSDGRQLIVYNHSGHRAAEAKGDRFPLDVAISTDGVKWKHVLTLEAEPVVSGYSYPAVIQTIDGAVHVTYTWARKKIKHVVLDSTKL